MASARVCARKDGTTYTQVMFRENGKQRSHSFNDHSTALRFKRNIDRVGVAEARRIMHIEDVTGNEITLTEWCGLHCDQLTGVEPETVKKYRSYIANDLAEIGVLPLSAVTDVTVSRWIQGMHAAGASAKTIKNKHGFLSGAMKRAQATHRIQANPCEHTRLYRSDTDEMVFLERAEFDLIHSQMTDRWKPLFLWLVSTGMRFSEATALTINDIDPVAMTARVNKAWKYSTTGRRLGLTKSRKGQRTINLPAQALAAVDLTGDRTALLFPTESGGPITSQLATNKGWKPARAKAIAAGLAKEPRIHDLRHTCASWMINAGVPLPSIQAHLGHESIQTTVDRYGHLDRAAGKVAADAISRALG